MPCDFDPSGRTPLDVVAAVFDLEPAPAATVSAQEIAGMRARRDRVVRDVPQSEHGKAARFERMSHLVGSDMPRLLDAIEALTAFRTDALDTFRAIGLALGLPDPLAADAPADCPAEWNGKLSEKVAAVVAEREALTAENARLRSMLPPEPTDDRPLSEIVADLRAVVAASPEAQAGIAAYFAEQAEERWHDGTIYNAHRSQVDAAHAAKRNAWPRHCHSPSSCTRHGACMYMNCRHEGQDIRPAIAAHAAAKAGD